jgi:signal transduction histidine kinase
MERTFWSSAKSAKQFGIGIVGLMLITLAAVWLNLAPGATSFLYLIVIVFVSLRAAFVLSVALSLMAVFLLQFYFIPRFASSAPGSKSFPFAILASAAFLVTAWVITAMVSRVRKLTEDQLTLGFEERLAERTRIARELHDTLLQSFQGLMLHFQIVNDMLPPGAAKEALESALDRADRAIVEGRNAIQNLRFSTNVTNELAQAIAALGDEFAGRDGERDSARLRVSLSGKPHELHPILRDDVYRIAREALQNAFVHAHATTIEADITYAERLLRVRIRDDGMGIDSSVMATGREGHWGLQGMRERAQQIGAQLEIWSKAGAGTEVNLLVPGSIAYAIPTGTGLSGGSQAEGRGR